MDKTAVSKPKLSLAQQPAGGDTSQHRHSWGQKGTSALAAVVWTPARGRQGHADTGLEAAGSSNHILTQPLQNRDLTTLPDRVKNTGLHKLLISFVMRLYAE